MPIYHLPNLLNPMNIKLLTASTFTALGLIIALTRLNSHQLTLVALGALPTGMIAHFSASEMLARNDRKFSSVVSKLQLELTESKTLQQSTEANLNKAIASDSLLRSELLKLNNNLTIVKSQAEELVNSLNCQLENYKVEIDNKAIELKEAWGQIEVNNGEIDELNLKIEELETEIEVWKDTFIEKLASESKAGIDRAKLTIMSKLFNDFKSIGLRHESGIQELRNWTEVVSQRLADKTEVMISVTDSYVNNLDSLNNQKLGELNAANDRIDSLIGQIRLLEIKLAGDLVEPQYYNTSYDINAQIGNSIAKEFYSQTQIPLIVTGFLVKSDGAIDIGFAYSKNNNPEAIVTTLNQLKVPLAKSLGIYKITTVKKLEVTDCITLTFRREPAIKDDEIKNLVGTDDEFIAYVVNHPIRYRLIANPNSGKTPTLAVMVSEILKTGTKKGNVSRGKKVDHTLVTVSYPGVESSLKDTDYPLDLFVRYGNETAANKSFRDAVDDWKFRKQYPSYAEKFFQLWIWEELDNTLDSASDTQDSSDNLKKICKQGGHSNIGFIVSGQSVMTKQIKGFTNDDRTLFTEIIMGVPKIRKYLATYGSKAANIQRLLTNLDDIEEYINVKNSSITDEARLLRLALVMDDRSPKLYFLPNLDRVLFNHNDVDITESAAKSMRENIMSGNIGVEAESTNLALDDTMSNTTMEGIETSDIKATCTHCGSQKLTVQSDKRYYCLDCKKRMTASKVVYK